MGIDVHPYRDPPPEAPPRDEGDDDRIAAGALVVAGILPVVSAWIAGDPFGAAPSLGLLAAAAGVALLVRRGAR